VWQGKYCNIYIYTKPTNKNNRLNYKQYNYSVQGSSHHSEQSLTMKILLEVEIQVVAAKTHHEDTGLCSHVLFDLIFSVSEGFQTMATEVLYFIYIMAIYNYIIYSKASYHLNPYK